MLQTLIVLLSAHVVADFVLQTSAMVRRKKNPLVLLAHGVIVAAAAAAISGSLDPAALGVLAGSHLLIDAWKPFLTKQGLAAFLIDQSAHVAVIVGLSAYRPDLFATGYWGGAPEMGGYVLDPRVYLKGWTVITGFLLATTVTGHGIALFTDTLGYSEDQRDPGLQNGGRYIGLFERTLVFAVTMANRLETIGFLVAAKSLLRMNAAQGERRASEYIIIGTLLSFGSALLWGLGTRTVLEALG